MEDRCCLFRNQSSIGAICCNPGENFLQRFFSAILACDHYNLSLLSCRFSFRLNYKEATIFRHLSLFARFSIALERVEVNIPMFHYFIFERRSRTFLPQYWSPCHSSSASSDPSETTLISLVVRCVSSQRVRNLVHVIHNVDVLIHFLIVDQCDIIFLEF